MSADQLLRKHFWVVFGGLTVTLAAMQSQAVAQWFGSTLLRDSTDGGPLSLPAPVPVAINTTTQKSTSADTILMRNPFDSVTGRLNAPAAVEDAGATELEAGDPMADPLCEGMKITIIAASTDPEYSFASFGVADKSYMRRKGDDLNGRTVHFIGWDRAWLTQSGQRCQVVLFQSSMPATGPGVVDAGPPPPPKSGASATPEDIKKGIQKISANEFNVDRSVIDKIKDNWAELMKFARSTPVKDENGKTIGQRLLGIRPDTVLSQLGIENGDVLTGINGFDMNDPTKMLEAYTRLTTAPDVSVSVQRGGKPVNVQYHMK